MSSDSAVPSPGSVHGGSLDEQISQLMQCKPLSAQEVNVQKLFTYLLEMLFDLFLEFRFFFLSLWEFTVLFFGEIKELFVYVVESGDVVKWVC